MTTETGGPAFPPTHNPDTHPSGMTLRDYMAAKAMQGVLANPSSDYETLDLVEYAYKVADFMLAARTK